MILDRLNFIFVLYRGRIKNGKAALYGRITYKKKRRSFSTGEYIDPKLWDSRKQLVGGDSEESDLKNKHLTLIRNKINHSFLSLKIKDVDFSVDDIFRVFIGEKDTNEIGVIEYYDIYLKKYKKLINIELKQETYKKYFYIKSDIMRVLKSDFKKNDILLKDLKPNFLDKLEYYYKTEKDYQQVTINKKLQRFKRVIKMAVVDGFLQRNPFELHKAKPVKKKIVFLNQKELFFIENYKFNQSRLSLIQDLFVFCCYTGLAYVDLMNLKQENIIDGFDGHKWIQIVREKTSRPVSIPILPKALEILAKFDNDNYVFPRISNQKYNSYLKEVAFIIGIEKRLTTHIARRTFASTVLLFNEVPMEIVSELLGHSSMIITQRHYGKIVQQSVSNEMSKLRNKLK
ncbi:site-specific integrase [Winogradskyella tangerina]|uniref:site-specific integrase n=1 Tax=Winogradskyella tangerina TaxID=2023240 RepID=UPI000DBE9251|nr:site-specific integrase [Winogradskyella tangerina]